VQRLEKAQIALVQAELRSELLFNMHTTDHIQMRQYHPKDYFFPFQGTGV